MRVIVLACVAFVLGQAAQARDVALVLDWPEAAPAGELVAVARDNTGAVLDTVRFSIADDTREATLPLPSLSRQATTVQAGVLVNGTMRLQSQRTVVEGGQPPDRLQLSAALTAGFTTQYLCDTGREMTLAPDGAGFLLDGVQRFSPAGLDGRYIAEDGTTANRIPGLLQLESAEGDLLASCQPIPTPPLLPLQALGPQDRPTDAWRVETGLAGSVLTLPGEEAAPDTVPPTVATAISRQADDVLAFAIGDHTLRVRDLPCTLPRTDMPYPLTATLTGPDGPFTEGCAGDPLRALEGPAWQVTHLFGREVPRTVDGGAAFSLQVYAGRVSGRTSCNRYLGRATVVDAALRVVDLGTTRLSCPINLSHLENRFLDALEAATGIVRLPGGGIALYAGSMAVLVAER